MTVFGRDYATQSSYVPVKVGVDWVYEIAHEVPCGWRPEPLLISTLLIVLNKYMIIRCVHINNMCNINIFSFLIKNTQAFSSIVNFKYIYVVQLSAMQVLGHTPLTQIITAKNGLNLCAKFKGPVFSL